MELPSLQCNIGDEIGPHLRFRYRIRQACLVSLATVLTAALIELMLKNGVLRLRDLKHLMAIKWFVVGNDLTAAATVGLRKIPEDLIDLSLRHLLSFMAFMPVLSPLRAFTFRLLVALYVRTVR